MANGTVNRHTYPSISGISVVPARLTTPIPSSVMSPMNRYAYPGLQTMVRSQVSSVTYTSPNQITIPDASIIRVTLNTPNLQQIQSFPVISRQGDVHIHRDPNTGQLYQMTDQIHMGINRFTTTPNITPYLNARSNEILSSVPDSLKKEITNVSIVPYSQIQLVPLNSNSDYYI